MAPGQRVALVGGSGSGKSTLAKLVTGLFEPCSGEIRIDGHTLAAMGPRAPVELVASVDQDIRLFDGTVRDNITLWDATVDRCAPRGRADDVGLTQVFRSIAGSFYGSIEEGGRNLNGGQRQRMEIARALVRDPAVLVLDEATSALDAVTEGEILERRAPPRLTCLLVAHRLSTIRDCDEIIVLDRGKVVERGTHASLMAAAGAYARLIGAEVAT